MEVKKYENKRIERRIPLHFLIGLNVSLLLTLAAFEWKSEIAPTEIPYDPVEKEKWEEPPIFKVSTIPPKPKPTTPLINEVKDDVVQAEKQIEVTIDDVPDPEPTELGVIDFDPVPIPPENPEEIFLPFEAQPNFEGGMDEFYKFLGKKIRYPSGAQRIGLEGKVFVSFVVEKDGSLSEIEVVRGLSTTCDAEAVRVMNLVTGFIPGKQRGKPVRVRMTIPIVYKLK